jgi:hypothetical protein
MIWGLLNYLGLRFISRRNKSWLNWKACGFKKMISAFKLIRNLKLDRSCLSWIKISWRRLLLRWGPWSKNIILRSKNYSFRLFESASRKCFIRQKIFFFYWLQYLLLLLIWLSFENRTHRNFLFRARISSIKISFIFQRLYLSNSCHLI